MRLPVLSPSQMSQGGQQHAQADAWNSSTCDGCPSPGPSAEEVGAVLLGAGENSGSSARTRVVGRLRRSVPQAETHWGQGGLGGTEGNFCHIFLPQKTRVSLFHLMLV